MDKETRKAALAQYHDTNVAVTNVFVQFVNLENAPSVRFFTISGENRKRIRFLDNSEILDTSKKEKDECNYERLRLDLEYYYNPALGNIGKLSGFVLYLEEHNSETKGVINKFMQECRTNFIPAVEKELSELLINPDSGKERAEVKIKELVTLQDKINEGLQTYWPSPMPTLQKMHKIIEESVRNF